MTIRSAPYYWLVCDVCGVTSTEDSDYAAWADQEQAVGHAEDGDWDVKGESALCETCGPFCEAKGCLAQADDDGCCPVHAAPAPAIESAP